MPTDRQTENIRPTLEAAKKAREAAEALFKPRQPVVSPDAPIATNAPSAAEHAPTRAPRILAALRPVSERNEPTAQSAAAQPKPKRAATTRRVKKIPTSHHARIRTLATYGMTLEQLAELYGVPVSDIEGIAGAAAA